MFEPTTRKPRYQAELQTRRKKKVESWADFADDLRRVADKTYPELESMARETLALNAYLAQLENPQIVFGVRQKTPATLDEAMTATLELESYLSPKMTVASVETGEAVIGVVSQKDNLTTFVEKLMDRMEKIELSHAGRQMKKNPPADSRSVVRTTSRGPQRAPTGNRITDQAC